MYGCSRGPSHLQQTVRSFATHHAPVDLDCSGPREAYELGRASVQGGNVPRGGRPTAECIAAWSRGVTDGVAAARASLTEERAAYLWATMPRANVPSSRSELPESNTVDDI